MKQESELLRSGGFAAKQIFADCGILRWSHTSRFKKGIELVKKLSPGSILDYGCGDGTFLIFLKDLVPEKTGMDVDTTQLGLLKQRFSEEKNYQFHHINEVIEKKFDMVTCFEVLEHCTDENIKKILTKLSNLCNDNGTIIMSVPKETGLTMVGKQSVRRLLGMRKFGTYEFTERYSFAEFFKMLFATEKTKVYRRPVELNFMGEKITTYGHKGFNWKSLKLAIQEKFQLQKIEFTPQILPCGIVSSQVWFICKKKT